MSFSFFTLDTEEIVLGVNSWNWRATLEIIDSFKILDSETIYRMGCGCAYYPEISKNQAREIAKRLKCEYIDRMHNNDRILFDLSMTNEPDDGTLYQGDDVDKNYSATKEWLIEFYEFCNSCNGFSVG